MLSMPGKQTLAGLALAAMALAGCGSDGTETAGRTGSEQASATVVVDGSSTVYRISKAAQEAFEAVNPEVTVVVDNHGTGGGFSRYLQGEVDIVDASRTAKGTRKPRPRPRASSGRGSWSAMTASPWWSTPRTRSSSRSPSSSSRSSGGRVRP